MTSNSSFLDIGDDLVLRNLCRQITHLHLDAKAASADDTATVSRTFALLLSTCEKLIELEFSRCIPDSMLEVTRCYMFRNEFLSATLTRLKINVSNFYDCILLLDGRLESLSILIIDVADIFEAAVDLSGTVSPIN